MHHHRSEPTLGLGGIQSNYLCVTLPSARGWTGSAQLDTKRGCENTFKKKRRRKNGIRVVVFSMTFHQRGGAGGEGPVCYSTPKFWHTPNALAPVSGPDGIALLLASPERSKKKPARHTHVDQVSQKEYEQHDACVQLFCTGGSRLLHCVGTRIYDGALIRCVMYHQLQQRVQCGRSKVMK